MRSLTRSTASHSPCLTTIASMPLLSMTLSTALARVRECNSTRFSLPPSPWSPAAVSAPSGDRMKRCITLAIPTARNMAVSPTNASDCASRNSSTQCVTIQACCVSVANSRISISISLTLPTCSEASVPGICRVTREAKRHPTVYPAPCRRKASPTP